jgi:sorting nexin-8
VQGETSSFECAHQLGRLCENRQLVVNLIPYNATDVKDKLQCPSTEHMQKFRDIVASYGTFCTIRRTMGADIASACGQLVQKTKEGETASQPVDIEDVVGGNSKSPDASFPSAPARSISQDPVDVIDETPADHHLPAAEPSWLDSIPSEKLDLWMNGLFIATAVSSSCFMISTVLYLRRR